MTKKSRDRRVALRAKQRQRRLLIEVMDDDVEFYMEHYKEMQEEQLAHQLDAIGVGRVMMALTGTNADLIPTYKAILNSRINKKHGDDSRK